MSLELFSDKDCTRPLVDLGELEVTEFKKIDVFIRNMGLTKIVRIVIQTDDIGIKIKHCPEKLNRHEVGKVILEWSVPEETMEGLRDVRFTIQGVSVGIVNE